MYRHLPAFAFVLAITVTLIHKLEQWVSTVQQHSCYSVVIIFLSLFLSKVCNDRTCLRYTTVSYQLRDTARKSCLLGSKQRQNQSAELLRRCSSYKTRCGLAFEIRTKFYPSRLLSPYCGTFSARMHHLTLIQEQYNIFSFSYFLYPSIIIFFMQLKLHITIFNSGFNMSVVSILLC